MLVLFRRAVVLGESFAIPTSPEAFGKQFEPRRLQAMRIPLGGVFVVPFAERFFGLKAKPRPLLVAAEVRFFDEETVVGRLLVPAWRHRENAERNTGCFGGVFRRADDLKLGEFLAGEVREVASFVEKCEQRRSLSETHAANDVEN